MSELVTYIDNLITTYPTLVTWSGVALILLTCLLTQKTFISEFLNEYKLNRLINSLGRESMHNITIPDGMDGKIYVEHLILTAEGILLLRVMRFRGTIFAADSIDYWTQVIGKKSYKFENPLHQLETDVQSLSAYVEIAKIQSKVLFINGSSFPKGKPDSVISVKDIRELAREYVAGEIPDAIRTDWKRLQDLASGDDLSENHVLVDNNSPTSGINVFSLLICSAVLALWLVVRLTS